MDRNAVLAAALGTAVLGACTSGGPRPGPTPSPAPPSPTPADPDLALLTRWHAAERTLAARYAALARRVPELAALRANHLTRADAVRDHLAVRGAAPAPVTANPLRGRPAALVRTLADAERRLAAEYVAALAAVRDPEVATLGAELAAGARQHATLLRLVPLPA